MYTEEDYLMLSGIQHFAFCRWECNIETPAESGVTAANCFVCKRKWNYVMKDKDYSSVFG